MGSRFAWGIAPGFVDLTIASAGNIATFPDTLSQLIAPAAAPVPTQSQWGGLHCQSCWVCSAVSGYADDMTINEATVERAFHVKR